MPQTSQFEDLGPAGRFSLGTVQIGMPYGMGAARAGLDAATAFEILDAAARCGVVWLDTAHAYGEAEARIGDWLARRGGDFRIVTKLPALASVHGCDVADHVASAVEESCARLGVARVDICLTHHGADLLRPGVAGTMRILQARGLVGRFGASVYTAEETRQVLDVEGIGALQVPLNAVAAPVAEAGLVERAAAQGIAVFARSVFLQGVLLRPPEQIPAHLAALAPVVARLRETADARRVPLTAMLMDAVARMKGVYSLVIGADSPEQVEELAACVRLREQDSVLPDELRALAAALPALATDPRQWARAAELCAGG